MERKDLRIIFKADTGLEWLTKEHEVEIDYVEWLENKVIYALIIKEELKKEK